MAKQVSAKASTLCDVEDLVASRNRPAINALLPQDQVPNTQLTQAVGVVEIEWVAAPDRSRAQHKTRMR